MNSPSREEQMVERLMSVLVAIGMGLVVAAVLFLGAAGDFASVGAVRALLGI